MSAIPNWGQAPEDIQLGADARTPLLAGMELVIAQTYLLEMIKSEGVGGDASAAYEHVSEARKSLERYIDSASGA